MKKILFFLLMLVSVDSFAAAYTIGGNTIKSLATGWVGEGFFVDTEGPLPSGANCGAGNRFLIQPTTPMQKEMVSLLLVALQNKSPILLYVDGCEGGVMKLKSVTISSQ
ncbi:hypothetical protein [Xanthomonas arboricola]|uniref:hypothetical protein n=1 Tax=Xanthomonas arboricola TaxID=56448 RepID=UPI000CABFEF5|nr:hypothetical protein [Xanthomonas arboricola]SOT98328.1 hypothetical protein CFBP6773_02024 [Xanthomonas arboricola pv. fragariae]